MGAVWDNEIFLLKNWQIHNGSGLATGSECQHTYNKNQAGPEET